MISLDDEDDFKVEWKPIISETSDDEKNSSASNTVQEDDEILEVFGEEPGIIENLGDLIRSALSESRNRKKFFDENSIISFISSSGSSSSDVEESISAKCSVTEEPTDIENRNEFYSVPLSPLKEEYYQKSLRLDMDRFLMQSLIESSESERVDGTNYSFTEAIERDSHLVRFPILNLFSY